MLQLYKGKRIEDLEPANESVIDILTRDKITVLEVLVKNHLGIQTEVIGINIIIEGDRGFGNSNKREFYEIDVKTKKIFNYGYPFRHLDKCTLSEHYFLPLGVTSEMIIKEFTDAGYELMNREKSMSDFK